MPHSLPLPPPGSDALPVEDQIEYVQSLWDRIAATAGQVPLQDWQQALLEERLAEHRRAPEEARPSEEVIERVQQRLRWVIRNEDEHASATTAHHFQR